MIAVRDHSRGTAGITNEDNTKRINTLNAPNMISKMKTRAKESRRTQYTVYDAIDEP